MQPSHDGTALILNALKAEIGAAEQRGAESILRLSLDAIAQLKKTQRGASAPYGLKRDGTPAKKRGRKSGGKNRS